MARRKKGYRVKGPYKHGNRWRIILVRPDGEQIVESFGSQEEAEKSAKACRKKVPGRVRLYEVFRRYRKHLEDKGNKPKSINLTLWRLDRWMDESLAVDDVTEAMIKSKYQQRCKTLAVDSHRNELAEIKTFWRWSIQQGYVSRSPAEKVQPIGKRKKGKKQLRIGEAAILRRKLIEQAFAGDDAALAVLMALMLGLRSGEVRERKINDIDLLGPSVILWIDRGKSDAAQRWMRVPKPLSCLLRMKTYGKKQDDWVFPARSESGHRGLTWLRKNTKKLCQELNISIVTPHGLRGTLATLAYEAGAPAHMVSKMMGHVSPKITEEFYARPGSFDQSAMDRLAQLLAENTNPLDPIRENSGSNGLTDAERGEKPNKNMELNGIEPSAS